MGSSNDCLLFSDQKCFSVNKRKEMLQLTFRDLLNKVIDNNLLPVLKEMKNNSN